MATANLATIDVEGLARALDAHTAERWHDPHATYAWIDSATRDLRLGPPPAAHVPAVAFTCVGTRCREDEPDPEADETVRVTVAVSCCQAAALLRHADGRVENATSVVGATVATLRAWASLNACVPCSGGQGASGVTEPGIAAHGGCSLGSRAPSE